MVRQDNRMPIALLPGLRRLRAYQPTRLRGDLLAGASTIPGLVLYRYDAPLCFANSEDFRRRALIDITAADVLQEFHDELTAKGIVFGMAKVKHDLYQQLSKAGVVGRIGAERIFPTLQKAIAAFRLEQPAQTAPSSISYKA